MTDRFEFSPFGMKKSGVPTITLGEMYDPDTLRCAQAIWADPRYLNDSSLEKVKGALRDQIVKPRLDHINKVTGQENDPDFLAYQLISVFMTLRKDHD